MAVIPNAGCGCVQFYYMQENLINSNVLLEQKSKDGENPQATLVDIGYLSAMIDGEGYVGIIKQKRKGNYRHDKVDYQPTICIVNTDSNIINKLIKILDNLKISAHLHDSWDGDPNHAIRYSIAIRKKDSIKKLLGLVLGSLYGKRSKAELMLRFLNARLKREKSNQILTDEEISLAEQFILLYRKESPQRPYVERLTNEEMVQSS